jgi:hypothetical protein
MASVGLAYPGPQQVDIGVPLAGAQTTTNWRRSITDFPRSSPHDDAGQPEIIIVPQARWAEAGDDAGRAEWTPRPRFDNAMVKALARAFRWRKMLDEGAYGTLEDLARAKSVHATYVSRLLRLTLLAPEIVEARL